MEKLFDKSWAVLIGVGKFQSNEIRPLNTTQNDVNKIEEVLTTYCGYEANNITKIIDENATLRDIRRFFEGDFSNQVGTNDRVTVFYSGHGTTRPPHGREPERGYFAPHDADFIDGETDWTSVFQLDEFIPFVTNRIIARQLLFLFDCCFSGLIIQPPEYESQREFKCATDMINAAKNNRSVQIYTAASKDEEILASSGISPPISVFTESIERIIKNVNPLNYPEGFLSAHKLSKDATMLVRETSILLRVPQNPVYYFSTLDDRGEFVFKQFTEDEINNAKDTMKIKFEPLEEFIGKSDLSEVFNEQNLVGLKRLVEQNHGLDYTFQQLQSTIHDLVRQHGSIVTAVNTLNLDGTNFSIEQIFNYVANSLIGLGLARDVFKPHFVHKSNMDQEETS